MLGDTPPELNGSRHDLFHVDHFTRSGTVVFLKAGICDEATARVVVAYGQRHSYPSVSISDILLYCGRWWKFVGCSPAAAV